MRRTVETFPVGAKVKVNGTPLHNGKVGVVVDPVDSLIAARALARKQGRKLSEGPAHRPGLVAVFMPDFPETLWWWFAPHQLDIAR